MLTGFRPLSIQLPRSLSHAAFPTGTPFRALSSLKAVFPLMAILVALQLAGHGQEQQKKGPFIPAHVKAKLRAFIEAQPHINGQWDTLPFRMPINPVHVALMHNGKVLVISGSGSDPNN